MFREVMSVTRSRGSPTDRALHTLPLGAQGDMSQTEGEPNPFFSLFFCRPLTLCGPSNKGSSINDVMPEGGRGGSGLHDQQC